jgi:hypothetical protein
LCQEKLTKDVSEFFNRKIQIPRIKYGRNQTLETLISKEVLLLAKYLRNERKTWSPRLPTVIS